MIAKVVISTKTENRNVQIGSTRIHVGCNTIPNSSPVISGLCILTFTGLHNGGQDSRAVVVPKVMMIMGLYCIYEMELFGYTVYFTILLGREERGSMTFIDKNCCG